MAVTLFLFACGGGTTVGTAATGAAPANPPGDRTASQQSPTLPSTASNRPPLPVTILPFDYQEKSVGDGWKIAIARLYFINASSQPVPPQTIGVTGASVETLEKKT
ncbi:MAG: hypothetical protein M1482_01260 [Chloroflexi bacterium]|nr:hypothetical protein [Chloroflexota bacterium]